MTTTGAIGTRDEDLIPGLLRRDEATFRLLVRRHHVRLIAVARGASLPVDAAEEVVQEAWLVVMRSLEAFEGRASLRTWLTGIVINLARRDARAGRRTRPFSDLVMADDTDDPFSPDHFLADGHWATPPWHWTQADLEATLGNSQVRSALDAAIEALPETERSVIRLRGAEGLGAPKVEALTGLTEARQRRLRHKARVRVRARLDGLVR